PDHPSLFLQPSLRARAALSIGPSHQARRLGFCSEFLLRASTPIFYSEFLARAFGSRHLACGLDLDRLKSIQSVREKCRTSCCFLSQSLSVNKMESNTFGF